MKNKAYIIFSFDTNVIINNTVGTGSALHIYQSIVVISCDLYSATSSF